MTYLLDTNVVSEMRRPARLPRVVAAWIGGLEAEALFLSVATLFELEVGVRRLERRDPRRGAILRRWRNGRLAGAFRGRILPVDEDVVDCCAALHVPDPRPLVDSLIAATAIVHKLTLVTRNEFDFAGIPVAVVNPWARALGGDRRPPARNAERPARANPKSRPSVHITQVPRRRSTFLDLRRNRAILAQTRR